jgi:hypothetical protein
MAAGLITAADAAEVYRRVFREIVGVGNAETDLTEKQELLNRALKEGVISASEFDKAMRELKKGVEDTANFIKDALESAFSKAADALAEFVTTGKIDFKKLINSIIADLTRLAAQQVFKQLAAGLFSAGSSGGGGLFSGLSGLFGFASGGAFQVGGVPGTDRNILSVNNQPVARVSRGETVSVTPQGQGQAPTINFFINTPDANSFERSQGQILARTQAALTRATARNR